MRKGLLSAEVLNSEMIDCEVSILFSINKMKKKIFLDLYKHFFETKNTLSSI